MEILGYALFIVGFVIALGGGIWFIVVAFQESVLWGLACLLIQPVSFIFLIVHWDEAQHPFFISLGGIGVAALSSFFIG